MRSVAAWAALMAAVAAAPVARAGSCSIGVIADLPVTMDGLRATVPVSVNGRETRFWLDSGAFFSIMPMAKALELGLKPGTVPVEGFELTGIGGGFNTAYVVIKSFGFATTKLTDVGFLVGGTDAGNGLIGANTLGFADTEFDLADGSVKLTRARGCGKAPLAYWAAGKQHFEAQLIVDSAHGGHGFDLWVTINGARIKATIDSGAYTSLLSRRAAERAGIALAGPGVVAIDGIGGFGRRRARGWTVPVDDIGIGDQHILRTRLDVIDGPIIDLDDAPEMLLGADWLLAHRVYVARDQRMIYFTYSGGKPFATSSPPPADVVARAVALPAGARRVEALTPTAAPATAQEFARRAKVRQAQESRADALADLTRAIALAPGDAGHYRERAELYLASGERNKAAADLDRALSLAPADADALRTRATLRLDQGDRTGALVDADAAARLTTPASLDMVWVANLYGRLGQPARAVPLLDGVIAAHRDDAKLGSLLNARCWMRGLAGAELDRALDDCNRAIRRDGANPAFVDSRALVRFRQGAFAAALADYDAALKGDDQQPWSRYMRGATRRQLGDAAGALADLKAARAIEPGIDERAAR